MLTIRLATESDRDAIWEIFHLVVAKCDTYTFSRTIAREEALDYWFHPTTYTYVAQDDGRIVGTYILRANQPGAGAHVANAAFMVAPQGQSRGVGHAMGEHSLTEARRLGFRAMQFNFVVSTNVVAVRLWQTLGFKIVGTLPGAFRHPEKGYVDAYVMFLSLLD